jgi:Fe-S cluster biogenesis protein NfuA/nitrite reductase/ring-hydroxylating ferredoxin subunit
VAVAEQADWQAAGERIDALIAASASGGAVARERSEELVRLVVDLYGAGLERVLDVVHEQGHLTDEVLDALAADDLVASLLLVHGLHPYSLETRVEKALDGVRPYLASHGGDVELLAVTDDGVARLRLLGSCDGCPSSSATLTLAVEGAIEAAAPEITTIEVEQPAAEPAAGPVIPVASLFARVGTGADRGGSWLSVPDLVGLPPGGVTRVDAGGIAILACRVDADLFAFADRCAQCSASLAGAALSRRLGAGPPEILLCCPRCHAHFDVRRAGACVDTGAELAHLEPLPLLADGATVSVAVPATVGT